MGSAWETSCPPTVMLPEEMGIRRLIIFRQVVFPQPDGPMSTAISPCSTVKLMSSMTFFSCPR